MALQKCKACGHEVSKKADKCPNCGEPIKTKSVRCAGAIGIVLLAVLIGSVWTAMQNPTASSSPARSSSLNQTPTPAAAKPPPGAQWAYSHSEDSMAKGRIHTAWAKSSNTVNFDFPYAGPQHGTLSLRTHPRYGKDLIFRIEKGQILCRAYDGCSALVRFDDADPIGYEAAGPEDNSTEVIFIKNYSGFVEHMLKSKRVRISVPVYQQGSPVFDFDVADFSQAKYLPK